MKITDIKPYAVWVGKRNQMLVKIETDEGIYGWGESGFSGRELGVKGIIEHYREFLIGKDPMKRGALWQEMYRSQYFEGGRTLTAAISAIDLISAFSSSYFMLPPPAPPNGYGAQPRGTGRKRWPRRPGLMPEGYQTPIRTRCATSAAAPC